MQDKALESLDILDFCTSCRSIEESLGNDDIKVICVYGSHKNISSTDDLTNFIVSLCVGLTGGLLVLLLSLIGCICCCVHNCCMRHKKNINGLATTTQATPKAIDKNVGSQLVYYNSERGSTFI